MDVQTDLVEIVKLNDSIDKASNTRPPRRKNRVIRVKNVETECNTYPEELQGFLSRPLNWYLTNQEWQVNKMAQQQTIKIDQTSKEIKRPEATDKGWKKMFSWCTGIGEWKNGCWPFKKKNSENVEQEKQPIALSKPKVESNKTVVTREKEKIVEQKVMTNSDGPVQPDQTKIQEQLETVITPRVQPIETKVQEELKIQTVSRGNPDESEKIENRNEEKKELKKVRVESEENISPPSTSNIVQHDYRDNIKIINHNDPTKTCCYLCAQTTMALQTGIHKPQDIRNEHIQTIPEIIYSERLDKSVSNHFEAQQSPKKVTIYKENGTSCTGRKRKKRFIFFKKKHFNNMIKKLKQSKCTEKRKHVSCVTEGSLKECKAEEKIAKPPKSKKKKYKKCVKESKVEDKCLQEEITFCH